MAPNTPSRRGLGFGNVAMLGTGKRHRRMARRGGVVRIQRDVYDAARKAIIGRIIDILETTNSQNRQRKTVTSRDD
ncbi:hypothetical protein FQN51_006706 [Onygenales sp. PD_10]|nr:hypothetical protein FQN51_006706 [Onygenales sp. PD_10]